MLRRALLRVCAVAFVCGFAQSVAAQDCAEERILKSGTGTAASELLFRNQGAERRKVYWLDGNGQRTFYSAVEPNNVYQQQTLESHVWVVTDEADKCLDIVTATATPAHDRYRLAAGGRGRAPPPPGSQQQIAQQPPAAAPPPPPSGPGGDARQLFQDNQQAGPPVSPVAQFQLQGLYRLTTRTEQGTALNLQPTGRTELLRGKPEWSSGHWQFEEVPGTPFVRIRSNWKKTLLLDDGSGPRAAQTSPDNPQAQWSFEPVDGLPYVAFQNRATNRLLAVERGAVALADRVANEADIHWELNPLAAGGRPVAAAQPLMRDPGRFRAYESALSNCRAMGGYWTGSSCRFPEARARDCGPGWIWDEFGGECVFDGGGRPVCPPWQFGTPPNCQSDMTCRGGNLRISRRGSPSCDCPPGTGIWGAFPNFTCVSAFARPGVIAPIPGFIPLRPVQRRGRSQPVPRDKPARRRTASSHLRRATCPAGQVGTPPNCAPPPPTVPPALQRCPAGQTGTPPNCVVAPAATCPAGQVGTPPNCAPPPPPLPPGVCPAGQTGTPPNCVTPPPPPPATCPAGQTGTPPNCVTPPPATCPAGQTGTPPNCRPAPAATCPTGQLGTPPNCTPAAPCAPWQTGTPGNCVDIQVTCTGGTVSQGICRCPTGTRASAAETIGNACSRPARAACTCRAARGNAAATTRTMCRPGPRRISFARLRGRRRPRHVRRAKLARRRIASHLHHRRPRHVRPARPGRRRIVLRPPRRNMSGRSNRHAAELRHSAARHMSGGSNGNAAELRHSAARNMSGWSNRNASELCHATTTAARDMSGRSDRHAAELRYAAARHMSGRTNRHTAELPSCTRRNMSDRSDSVRRRTARRLRPARRGKPERPAIASTFK